MWSYHTCTCINIFLIPVFLLCMHVITNPLVVFQVQELTFRLDEVSESKRETEECLATVQEELERVRMELADKTSSLTLTVSELEENKDRLLAMEEDAGVEFRSKIRTLERQLGDSNAKVRRACSFRSVVQSTMHNVLPFL